MPPPDDVSPAPSGRPPPPADPREWLDHVIVCGLQDVGLRVVEQLRLAGARVVVVHDEGDDHFARVARAWGIPLLTRSANLSDSLYAAGIEGALAVVCTETNDLRALETVLLVRDLRPDVRLVAQLDNPAMAHAIRDISGAATVLDVGSLFAPAVVKTCQNRSSREIELGSVKFVSLEIDVPRAATLRELYGSLIPLGVVRGAEGELVVSPDRDDPVSAGDRVTLLGTGPEFEAAGLSPAGDDDDPIRPGRRWIDRMRIVGAQVAANVSGPLRVVLALGILLGITSTLVLHFGYTRVGIHSHLSFVDALYFTVETVATVGFGDFSFASQPLWLEIFGISLIVAGTTLVTTLFALLTNTLVSRRLAQSLGQAQIPGMRGHVVIVGLGTVGIRVLDGLLERGSQVVVVERDESNRYVSDVRRRGVPLVLGDATLARTLDAANLARAASIAILTSDDLTNIETGLAVRERLGERWQDTPVVVRVFDRHLGRRLQDSFSFRHVWSTAALAAPWFVGAALGLDVLFNVYVGNHPFLLARLRISLGGGLDGLALSELSAAVCVVAIARAESPDVLEHPPSRDTLLEAGDAAYLAGPDGELLALLRRERVGRRVARSFIGRLM